MKYRVGEREFDSAEQAEAFRSSLPSAPPVFAVDPDAAPARVTAPTIGRWKAPNHWAIAIGLFALDVSLELALPVPGRDYSKLPVLAWVCAGVVVALQVFVTGWALGTLFDPRSRGLARITALVWSALVFVGFVLFVPIRLLEISRARLALPRLSAPAAPRVSLDEPPQDAGPPTPRTARTWQPVRVEDGRFAASFPGAPVTTPRRARVRSSEVVCEDGARFGVRWTDHAETTSRGEARRLVDEARARLVQEANGLVLDERDEARNGVLAREVRVAVPGEPPMVAQARFVLVGRRLYVLGALVRASDPPGDVDAFFEGFSPDLPP